MAFDEYMAERVRRYFQERQADFYEKKMFGGLCFMVADKMCCGLLYSKKKQTDLLMARIGEESYEEALQRPGCMPMDFTGRPMKGFVFVLPEGYDAEDDLNYWLDACMRFNPEAHSSKRKS